MQWLVATWARDHAWGVFPLHHPFREWIRAVHSSPVYGRLVLFLIVANCVALALDDPLCVDECRNTSRLVSTLTWAEYVFVLVFTLEIAIATVAKGLAWNDGGA